MSETPVPSRSEARLLIRADMREQRSPVVALLSEHADLRLEFSALPTAD